MKTKTRTKKELLVELAALRRELVNFPGAGAGQQKEALKRFEEEYRMAVELSNDGVAWIEGTKIVFLNRKAYEIFGYDLQDKLIGKSILSFIHPNDRKRVMERALRRQRGEAAPAKYELKGLRKDGQPVCMEISIALANNQGKAVTLIFVRDSTERKQTEAALRESQERYRTILETIADGYYEVDLTGRLTFFNDAMARINGYARDEMIGMVTRQYTDAENYRLLFREFNQVYRTGIPARGIQYEIITKNGEKRNLDTSASLIRDLSGNPIGFRGIARDITDLKRAQKDLSDSKELFRLAAESASDFIYEWDIPSGQLEWFGTAADKLGDLLGALPTTATSFDMVIHPEDSERIRKAVRQHLKTGEPYQEEYRILGREGHIIHMQGAGIAIQDANGRAYKWIGAVSDITKRKKDEEELRLSLDKLHKTLGGVIQAMVLTVESRDPYTSGHQQRVSKLGRAIAQAMDLSSDQVEAVRMAGAVHDLGKISVPSEILSKPTKLSDIEFKLLKVHPQTSYDILKDIEFPWPIALIALQHHERMDGSGYPAGLKGDELLIESRILMVADVVEAIASHRPYRPALGMEIALDEIAQQKGRLYDPVVVEACLKLFEERNFSFD
jgi:PAS domain S-box-containing protein